MLEREAAEAIVETAVRKIKAEKAERKARKLIKAPETP
jgi:hypothetical protein